MGEFGKRLITGIELVMIIIILPLLGDTMTSVAVLLLALIGLHEFYSGFNDEDIMKFILIPAFFTVVYFLIMRYKENSQELVLALFIITTLSISIVNEHVKVKTTIVLITGFFYIPFLFYNLAALSKEYFWITFIIAFGTDTFAYIGGRLFGKNKLSPNISPKKTIEGSLVGTIGAVVLVCIFNKFVFGTFSVNLIVPIVVASIFGQIGDLVASKFKRANEIKDFGKVFPGHGGVLDRFDSVLFVAPVVRLLFNLF